MDSIYKNVCIESWCFEPAPELLSSLRIEELLLPTYERLGLPEGRLELMSGIRERRIWPKGSTPSDAARIAAKKALAASSIPPSEIACLINCSVCRDCLEPATATIVHEGLALSRNCISFDISNACLGVLSAMIVAGNMIESGQIRAALLVAGENSRSLLESTIAKINGDLSITRKSIKRFFSSLTIGSGAVAIILAAKDRPLPVRRPSLVGGSSLTASEFNGLCRGNEDKGMGDNLDTLMNTDSENLMRAGVMVAAETWEHFKSATGWKNEDPDLICTHQVGSAHKKLLLETLGLPNEKDFSTLQNFGNMGSVSCPATFAMAMDAGRAGEGAKIALLGIGSGINCTMLGVEC